MVFDAEKDVNLGQSQDTEDSSLQKQEVDDHDWKEKYLHLSADFENFKKRLTREAASQERRAQIKLFVPLIEIIDDFDRALKESAKMEHAAQAVPLIEGFVMISKQFEKLIAGYGITRMEHTVNFDPEFHEAVAQVPSDKHTSGQIVEYYQDGYMFSGTVLRPAKVSVAV